jgi:hypothetical protein
MFVSVKELFSVYFSILKEKVNYSTNYLEMLNLTVSAILKNLPCCHASLVESLVRWQNVTVPKKWSRNFCLIWKPKNWLTY